MMNAYIILVYVPPTKTHACLISQNSSSISRKGSHETREESAIEASRAFLFPNVPGSLGYCGHTVLRHHSIFDDVRWKSKEPESSGSETTSQERMETGRNVPVSQFLIVDLFNSFEPASVYIKKMQAYLI